MYLNEMSELENTNSIFRVEVLVDKFSMLDFFFKPMIGKSESDTISSILFVVTIFSDSVSV